MIERPLACAAHPAGLWYNTTVDGGIVIKYCAGVVLLLLVVRILLPFVV